GEDQLPTADQHALLDGVGEAELAESVVGRDVGGKPVHAPSGGEAVAEGEAAHARAVEDEVSPAFGEAGIRLDVAAAASEGEEAQRVPAHFRIAGNAQLVVERYVLIELARITDGYLVHAQPGEGLRPSLLEGGLPRGHRLVAPPVLGGGAAANPALALHLGRASRAERQVELHVGDVVLGSRLRRDGEAALPVRLDHEDARSPVRDGQLGGTVEL